MARRRTPSAGERAAGRIEWALGAVSGLVFIALVATLVRAGLSDADAPPRLSVAAEPPADGVLRFTVRNDGGRTATAVALALVQGDGPTRQLVIDYLPGHSEASGGVLLPPGAAAPSLVVDGYVDP